MRVDVVRDGRNSQDRDAHRLGDLAFRDRYVDERSLEEVRR